MWSKSFVFVESILRRLLVGSCLLFVVCCGVFWVISSMPGDVFSSWRMDPSITRQQIEQLEKQYEINSSPIKRFGKWVWNLLHADLGYSVYYHDSVTSVIGRHFLPTILLSLISIVLAWAIGLFASVISVKYRWFSNVMDVLSYMSMSVPVFFLAVLVLLVAFKFKILPLGGMHGVWVYITNRISCISRLQDFLWHMMLPVTIIIIPVSAGIYRVAVSNLRKQMKMPYILYARSKGLSEWEIIIRYGLWNCIHPLVMMFGTQLSGLLSGVLLVEVICDWRGIGMLMWEAVLYRDVFLAMGIVLFSGIMVIIANLLADISLIWIDPRLRKDVVL